jgi:uncharacterized protein
LTWLEPLSGLLVGILVGLTGVGGGSLMAPIMILLLGVAPSTAVGTDLWFAASTKTVGGAVHHHTGSPDWNIVKLLSMGSIPAAIATLYFLSVTQAHKIEGGLIIQLLGAVLILTAVATLLRKYVHSTAKKIRVETATSFKRLQPALTVVAGVILGVLVTLTSVGAGALGATMLIMLYPLRLNTKSVVGTDIIHAVPLTAVAGLGHLWMGNVDFGLLLPLLAGSIPGIIIGSLLSSRMQNRFIRPALALVLAFAGYRLLT